MAQVPGCCPPCVLSPALLLPSTGLSLWCARSRIFRCHYQEGRKEVMDGGTAVGQLKRRWRTMQPECPSAGQLSWGMRQEKEGTPLPTHFHITFSNKPFPIFYNCASKFLVTFSMANERSEPSVKGVGTGQITLSMMQHLLGGAWPMGNNLQAVIRSCGRMHIYKISPIGQEIKGCNIWGLQLWQKEIERETFLLS